MPAVLLKGDSAQTSTPATNSEIISHVKHLPFAEGTIDTHLQVFSGIFSLGFLLCF